MFGRKTSGGKDVLAARVRQLAESRAMGSTSSGAASAELGARAPAHAEPTVARSVHSKPRAPREAVFRTATLITATGGRHNVAIKDISATGVRIEFYTRGELSQFVTLVEPSLKINRRARVVWQDDGAAGLQFLRDQDASAGR